MNITNKTILVTGGGSGIGYEIAKLLKQQGNTVIIAGRNADKIKKAGEKLGITAIACDVTREADIEKLVTRIQQEYPTLSVLVNNAGVANLYKLGEQAGAFQKAKQEFEVNYFAPLLLTEKLLPVLSQQSEAAIVNITSNVTFHPLILLPTYSDAKAALHSHTVALRHTLGKDSSIKVFEVMPSLVDTEATKDMGGSNGMHPQVVAEALLKGMQTDQYEIYVGATAQQRADYFANPVEAIEKFNAGL
ncbi:SDR family NAD(P)-dependent oxidoreductase [Cytophagaceae bacterium YF14B1]|uniref:SDR family NAD(P)-dependent oxidoreductase n=1 Tax=Xanthocytophaga flava TaxID=3048013 RepID=A0AAE3QPI9_9BACT|nr:SDR family NAD(P)-dependent oxidoreductase [Xanthocytophaga flavus]MDJ1480865.1 SDR family NAD(P)-dependent oxidoreductase [Xanthocytophaga flavus]